MHQPVVFSRCRPARVVPESPRPSIAPVSIWSHMKKLLSLVLLMPSFALAAMQDEAAASAPSETVSVVYVVVFAVIFVGMIAGFFIYLWWNEKHKKPE
jgi:hypothetical protein